jgi:hypothetical protein
MERGRFKYQESSRKDVGNKGQFVRRARILAAGHAKNKSHKDGFCGNKRRQKMRRTSSNNIYLLATMAKQSFGPISIESSAMLRIILDSIWTVGEIGLRTGTGKAHNPSYRYDARFASTSFQRGVSCQSRLDHS